MNDVPVWMLAAFLGLAALGACSDGAPEQQAAGEKESGPGPADWTAYVDTLGTLTLEEPDGVVTANPVVRIDPRGGFIVTDPNEQQVRLYAPDGSLRSYFGGEGGGPSEFRLPLGAARDPAGRLVVADVQLARISFFSADGDSALFQRGAPARTARDLVPLEDGTFLVVGREQGEESARWLHRWDPARDTVTERFFPSPVTGRIRLLGASLGSVSMDRRGDTLAAAFSMADSIFLLTEGPDGFEVVDRLEVPFASFEITFPDDQARTDPDARDEWLGETTLIDDLFWLPDGSFLVHSGRRGEDERIQGLLWMTRDGREIFEDTDAPELLTVTGDTAYFEHPDHLAPNEWLVVRMRRGGR